MAKTLLDAFKSEVTRISKKTIKKENAPFQEKVADLKKQVRLLKMRLDSMEKQLMPHTLKPPANTDKEYGQEDKVHQMRFSAKNMQALRSRLNMTQAEFAQKLGVSVMTVHAWEKGKSKPRDARVRLAIAELRKTSHSK